MVLFNNVIISTLFLTITIHKNSQLVNIRKYNINNVFTNY